MPGPVAGLFDLMGLRLLGVIDVLGVLAACLACFISHRNIILCKGKKPNMNIYYINFSMKKYYMTLPLNVAGAADYAELTK